MPDPTDGGMTYEEIFSKLRGPMIGIEELRGLLDLVEQGYTLADDSALRLIRSLAANRCAVPELQANARQAAIEEAATVVHDNLASQAKALWRAGDIVASDTLSNALGECVGRVRALITRAERGEG